MKIILKRIAAYLIDIILVTLISTLITSNSYINKDYNKYTKKYDEYENFYDDYISSIENIDKENLTDEEKNQKLEALENDFNKKNIDYSYELSKLSLIPSFINILCILLYFVVMQFYFGGITLGKKLMKLKVVSNNGKNLTILNFFIRSLILNSVFLSMVSIIFILSLSKSNYITYSNIISIINYVVELSIIFTILFDKNHRGIHDLLSNTKVVEIGGQYEV